VTDLDAVRADALAPLREALLDAARADAARALEEAERDADRTVAEARERASATLEDARRRGRADGASRLATARAATRRDARAVVLRAQRAAYEGLRAAAVDAVSQDLSGDEGRNRVRSLVEGTLGPDAELVDGPDGELHGRAPDGRVVDVSAARLVDLALARLDVEGLWSP
jgi:vacuolar-type H+-ATPase subunit H